MGVLISKYRDIIEAQKVVINTMKELIDGLKSQNQIQSEILANYKKMMTNYDRKIKILEELLRRKEEENETLAQRLDQLSSAAAGDSSVEGAVSDSGTSGEGSHT